MARLFPKATQEAGSLYVSVSWLMYYTNWDGAKSKCINECSRSSIVIFISRDDARYPLINSLFISLHQNYISSQFLVGRRRRTTQQKHERKKEEYQSSRKRYVFLNTSPVSDFPDIVHQYYLSLRVKMINILTRQPIKQSYWLTNSIYPRHETKINQQIDSIVNDLQVKYWLCPEICIPQNPDHNS